MTNCWSEGALRAYLDRELSAVDMKAVAAHLAECSACDGVCTELAARAARVFALLESLPEPAAVVALPQAPRRAVSKWIWPGAAVALAASLAIASFILEKRDRAVAFVPPPPMPVAHKTEAPPVVGEFRPVAVAPQAPPARARLASTKRRPAADMDYFVALDDKPIESGVIMRMAIQPGNTQADIVFDPAGRPRAIRLVNNK